MSTWWIASLVGFSPSFNGPTDITSIVRAGRTATIGLFCFDRAENLLMSGTVLALEFRLGR